jgi:hypothetical protein
MISREFIGSVVRARGEAVYAETKLRAWLPLEASRDIADHRDGHA